jgi:hypothetical protein
MIGFGEIRQLEIDRKSLSQLVGFTDCDAAYDVASSVRRSLAGTPRNRKSSQRLDGLEKMLPFLLFDYITEQPAERTDIPPQGSFFQFGRISEQLPQPFFLALGGPVRLVTK